MTTLREQVVEKLKEWKKKHKGIGSCHDCPDKVECHMSSPLITACSPCCPESARIETKDLANWLLASLTALGIEVD